MAKDNVMAIPGGAGGARGGVGRMSTGKMKKLAEPAKKYDPPVKGSGKEKYQNVIKSERLDTKASSKANLKTIKELVGKKVTKQELNRKAGKKPNVAKEIDREQKITKGVRTAKPTTPKVAVKKKAPTKRNLPSDI